MKVDYLIETVDKLVPNEFDKEDKIRWINQIETEIYETVVSKYKNPPVTSFNGVTGSSTLLAPDMFSEMYVQWIVANIYLSREETTKYNNAVNIYNQQLYDYRTWYSRTHRKTMTNISNFRAWGDI